MNRYLRNQQPQIDAMQPERQDNNRIDYSPNNIDGSVNVWRQGDDH